MSGWTWCGACPRCGAPMYVPAAYWSVVPPAPQRTCGCFPARKFSVSTTTQTGFK